MDDAISVMGKIERITESDEFVMSDQSGQIFVYVRPNPTPAAVGELATIQGSMDDDAGPLEIYAQKITLQNGQVVTLKNDDERMLKVMPRCLPNTGASYPARAG